MDSLGCGTIFLRAIQVAMEATGVIGTEKFETSAGVKQGGSSSCFLFTLYINATILAVKSTGSDEWLGNLHSLLMMDDTAIIATSWKKLNQKLIALKTCTDRIGMTWHPTKSQFISTDSSCPDQIILNDVTINKTNSYTYLGTPISFQPLSAQIKQHLKSKSAHVMKFTSFLNKKYRLSVHYQV